MNRIRFSAFCLTFQMLVSFDFMSMSVVCDNRHSYSNYFMLTVSSGPRLISFLHSYLISTVKYSLLISTVKYSLILEKYSYSKISVYHS